MQSRLGGYITDNAANVKKTSTLLEKRPELSVIT